MQGECYLVAPTSVGVAFLVTLLAPVVSCFVFRFTVCVVVFIPIAVQPAETRDVVAKAKLGAICVNGHRFSCFLGLVTYGFGWIQRALYCFKSA